MTRRECVLAAFQHRACARVPVDFSGHRSSGVAAIAYAKLRAHLGLPEKPIRVYDPVQQLAIVDDLGMQTAPQISPAMYREFFKRRHALLWQTAKQLADVKVMLHSCGSIHDLLPDLLEAGLDAVNPVQTTCAGMDLAALQRDFGNDIVLWGGGCDTRDILPQGTPAEVAEHVRAQTAIMRRGGGCVFQQVHNIMADVPPANIVAMFAAINSK